MSIFFLATITSVYCQEIKLPDSLRSRMDSSIFTNHWPDSIENKKNKTVDSIANVNEKINHRIEKVKDGVSNPTDALDTLNTGLNLHSQKMDSVRNKITTKIDSLSRLGLPHDQYTKALDSLNSIDPLNQVRKTEEKIVGLQSKVQQKIDQPSDKINEKLGMLRSESEGEGNLPGNVSPPGFTSPGLSGELPATTSVSSDISVPKIDLPAMSGDVNTNLDIKGKADGIGRLDEVARVQNGLSEASDVTEKLGTYTEDVKNISSGDLEDVKQIDKDLVAKVEVEEIGVLKEQSRLLEDHKNMVRSMRNEEEFKKQTLAKAREVVAEQLALQQGAIVESVNKISKHQKRTGTIFSKVKGLPKRPQKEKKPPFIERLVPGLTMQVQKTDMWFVDFNPTLRYRVRSIFSAGLGWNERVTFDNDFKFYKDGRIYGLRSFYELSVLKGLWVRADVERMRAFVPVDRNHQDIGKRENVWSYMAGIKKDFSFAPGVIGNVQFMYNLYDPNRTSPYFNRFNVRFGFEFPLKKKSQKK